MHPILFELGRLRVTSYGVALAFAFALGIAVAARRARREGIAATAVADAGLAVAVAALLGSRLLWVATHREALGDGGWLRALLPLGGSGLGITGLSMQGGVVLGIGAALATLWWRRVPLRPALDAMAPSAALGEGITRIGCFLNGCCFGLPCDLPFCVHFPGGSPAARLFGAAAVHPTQLYASAVGFVLFAALSFALPRRPFPGAIVCAWLVLAAAGRIGVDLFRYYEPSVTLFHAGGVPFTVNTAVALAAGALGAAGLAAGGLARYRSSGTPKRSR